LAIPFGPRVEVPILMHVATAQFDLVRTMDDFMTEPSWNSTHSYLKRIAATLDDTTQNWVLGSLTAEEIGDVTTVGTGGTAKMKAAAGAGPNSGAVDAVAADETLTNPHTVRLPMILLELPYTIIPIRSNFMHLLTWFLSLFILLLSFL
jgi:hypothetical protein